MSDNLDVVPQESVVNSPDTYEGPEAATNETVEADAHEEDEGPVSLDEPNEPESQEDDDPETGESEDGEEGEEPEEIEYQEFDFGGNKLEVPKGEIPEEVAEKLDKFSKDIWSDYTKKSQANAETAKTLKAKVEHLEKVESLGGEALDAFTKGKSIKAEIEQLSQVNMQALWQSNPDQARQLSDSLSAKQAELQSIIQTVDHYEHTIIQERQAELARVAEEGKQVLDRKYKGFSVEIAPKLEEYAMKNGIPEDDARLWAANPTVTEFAYKAMLYDQMQAAGKPKVTPKKAAPVRSMPNKGANKQSTDPSKMGFSELGKILGIKD